jgi:hypothetical protein
MIKEQSKQTETKVVGCVSRAKNQLNAKDERKEQDGKAIN